MRENNYWMSIKFWNFWSWKTFSEFYDLYKRDRSHFYLISNIPYSRVDHFFSTTDQLVEVFDTLGEYAEMTNQDVKKYADTVRFQKDIVIVVDEAHLHLGARESMAKVNIISKLKIILTQCRKRKIRILFITQRLTSIDIYVRRLADYVEEMDRKSLWPLQWVRKRVYENKGDVADIENENGQIVVNADGQAVSFKEWALIQKSLFKPLTWLLAIWPVFYKFFRDLSDEYYLSYYITWYHDVTVKKFSLEYLLSNIYKKKQEVVTKRQRLFNFKRN